MLAHMDVMVQVMVDDMLEGHMDMVEGHMVMVEDMEDIVMPHIENLVVVHMEVVVH